MHTSLLEYSHGDTLLEGFLASPDAGTARPSVLICHAWGGRDEFVATQAKALAELGYTAFALDVYGKGITGSGPEENSALMQSFLEDRALLRDRLLAGLAALRAQPQCDSDRVAATGYCFGGLCALDLARCGADLRGVVSFHGLFMPTGLPAQAIKARILSLHGWQDPMVPPEAVVALGEEFTKAGADWQLHGYGTAVHAFTNPAANDAGMGAIYNASAAQRSWAAMRYFLDEVFA